MHHMTARIWRESHRELSPDSAFPIDSQHSHSNRLQLWHHYLPQDWAPNTKHKSLLDMNCYPWNFHTSRGRVVCVIENIKRIWPVFSLPVQILSSHFQKLSPAWTVLTFVLHMWKCNFSHWPVLIFQPLSRVHMWKRTHMRDQLVNKA